MNRIFISLLLLAGPSAFAQNAGMMSLERYLEEVTAKNPEARAAIENVASYESRDREAEIALMPELYASFKRFDDKKPTAQPMFMGTETKGDQWRAGVRKQTSFGLGADLYFNAARTNVVGVPSNVMPVNDYMESSAALQLTQSLWRNGFGESTRAKVDADGAAIRLKLLEAKYKLKTLLLNARNAYWSVVSYNQVVKLQQENVERARKLRDYMNKRTRMKLFDDTDAMQAQAAFETRELELQTSLDERAVLVRQLNTLRGVDSNDVQSLEVLPPMNEISKIEAGGRMTREDFDMIRAQARAGVAQAKYAKSQIQPQLDLTGFVATNGRDGLTSESYGQAQTDHYPTWSVGITFSVPLDFGMVRDLRRGFRKASEASDSLHSQAEFSEIRAWDDLVQQKKEARGRFERAQSVEKIQTELVKRERTRLMNGRATTFEALNMEQNLALAQIQRVQAQLALLKVHNMIKTFEVKK